MQNDVEFKDIMLSKLCSCTDLKDIKGKLRKKKKKKNPDL
jgi:hypothetical protein